MNSDSINWYPGHMAKARRLISESLKLTDAAAEIIDARIPLSSKNPDIDELLSGKPRIIVLNKSDVADSEQTKLWQQYYRDKGFYTVVCDSRDKKGVTSFIPAAKKALSELTDKRSERGMTGKELRIMVLGVPNVGKSTFINALAGRAVAKSEDRPGVTRGKQWVTLQNGIALLDMPGILWHKLTTPQTGINLAITGAIRDQILDTAELAKILAELLMNNYPDSLTSRYKISGEYKDGFAALAAIAKSRGFLISGGELDIERAAAILLDEFRAGKTGRITLERCGTDEIVGI